MDWRKMSTNITINTSEIVTDIIIGFVFWCLFEGFAPMIWFYPLNMLEISGYEVFALAFCSPVLFVWPLKSTLQMKWVVYSLRLGTLIGLASFQASTTFNRLCALTVGVACATLVLCSSLYHANAKQRCLTAWGLILGKLLFVTSRVWFTSFVPTWWSVQSNSVVIAVSAVAILHKIAMGHDASPAGELSSKKIPPQPSSIVCGIGLASLVYLSNAVFGEVSLVTRWSVKGFPDTGPMPYPWGAVVLLAMFFGVLLSPCRHVTRSYIWWAIGSLSFLALYLLDTWAAFWGGVVLAVYTMSLWPSLLDQASRCRPAPTLALMGLFYVIEILFSIWTVAYNFVPGGVFTREHTGWLIAFVMSTLGLALYSYKRNLEEVESQTSFIVTSSGKMPNQAVSLCLTVLLLSGLGGFIYRYPGQTISHPDIQQPKADFTAAIWTYHFGYDNQGWPSMLEASLMLEKTGADVITLLESDASKPFLGNNDLAMWLAERLHMYVDFGVSTRDHTWGNLLLSKYPILKSRHIMLPSPEGEIAPAIVTTVNMTGHLVDFVVTHMGNDRDELDRKLQAGQLAKELKAAKNPVVFLGYLTSSPLGAEYNRLTGNGQMLDIDSTDYDRWCQYIFYRGLIRQGYARISHGGLSDTEIQIARFRIPEDPTNFKDYNKIVTDPEKVQETFRFNPGFGEFMREDNYELNHSFHMATPKYFDP